MSGSADLTRRSLLKAASAVGGCLVVGIPINGVAAAASDGDTPMGHFLRVTPRGEVTAIVPVVEMGQGIQSALATVLIDELGGDWSRTRVEPAPFGAAYQRPDVTKYQLTSGSWSIRLWYQPLRQAAAAAREMLVEAAARQWGADPTTCFAENGTIVHRPTGRRLGFGDVAGAAAALPVPTKPTLKPADQLKLVGKRLRRTDIPSKVDGSGVYGVDVKRPGMLYAAIRQAPVYGAEVDKVNRSTIAGHRGIVDVIVVPGAVVVIADSFWRAKKAIDALEVSFKDTAFDKVTSADLMAEESTKLSAAQAAPFRKVGDVSAAQAAAARTVSVDYTVPFLHHAPMEPMNCTAHVTADSCELWVPTQCHTTAMEAAVRLTGLDAGKIRVNATLLGGAFGRRIHTDFIEPAILASKAVGRPVKLIYTREEDMQHGFHRPAMSARLTGSVDEAGNLTGLRMRIVGPSVHEKFWPAFYKNGLDAAAVMAITTKNAAAGLHYAIANQLVDYVYQPTHVPIGYWRSVGASHNGFFMEGFIDEVAHATGQDPAAFRRRLLKDSPRGLAVLEKAVQASGWGSELPAGHARGIAFCENVDSIVAQVAEVSVIKDVLRVHRVTAVIDCGMVINPDTIEAQMQGGIAQALSAALAEEITIKDGRCVQSNFHDYPLMRLPACPQVDVHIVESGGPVGGVGEAMVPTLAPAVCNAIHAACGKRIRSLPIKSHGLTVS